MKSLFCDRAFLRGISGFERALAKVLSVTLTVVLVVATLQLLIFLGSDLLDLQVNWTGEGLVGLLDQVLVILIALEVLQNVTAYLRDQVVQIELVLLTALTAVARKVIVLPPGTENKPALMAGFGVIVVGLAAAYWLVRWARRGDPGRRPRGGSRAVRRWGPGSPRMAWESRTHRG